MSKLTAYGRAHIARRNFGLPRHRGDRPGVRGHYPIEDKAHARNALARGAQMVKRHKLSRSAYAKLRAKIHRRYPSIKMSGMKRRGTTSRTRRRR